MAAWWSYELRCVSTGLFERSPCVRSPLGGEFSFRLFSDDTVAGRGTTGLARRKTR